MFFLLLTIVFLEAGLIMKSPVERFVEALFWTTLGTYTCMNSKRRSKKVWVCHGHFVFTTGVLVPNLPVSITSLIDVIDKFAMDAKCSFSELRKSIRVVISVVRHSPCEGYWNARMTLQVSYKVATFPKDVVNLQTSKNSQTFWGVAIPISSGKRVSFNNYKMSTPPEI